MLYIMVCPKCGGTMKPTSGNMVDGVTVCDECFKQTCVDVELGQYCPIGAEARPECPANRGECGAAVCPYYGRM